MRRVPVAPGVLARRVREREDTSVTAEIACYRCGASLAALSLPFGRRDLCPSCSVYLHVCRMCVHYDPGVPGQCREEDAEDVLEKERPNFCEWFEPAANAYDPATGAGTASAQAELAALFGDEGGEATGDDNPLSEAEKLFRK